MDLYKIIDLLIEERNRIDRVIRKLDSGFSVAGRSAVRKTRSAEPAKKPGRRGRKSMDAAARQEVSERMRRYWQRRRTDLLGKSA